MIEKSLFEQIKERWDELDSSYDRLNVARETICELFRPDLGINYDQKADMLFLARNLYEGSPPWIARTASIGFMGNMVSKRDPWRMYKAEDNNLQGIDEIDEWTQACREHTSDVYQDGNFYDLQPQFTLNGLTIGSPVQFIEEDMKTGRTMFLPIHFKTYRLFYNEFGDLDGIIIKDDEWTAKKCFDKFCPGMTIQERLNKAEKLFTHGLYHALINNKMNQRFTIWRACFVQTDPIWENFKPPIGKTWYSVYFEDLKTPTAAEPLLVSGYTSKPFVVWNYNKHPWESSARTPAFEAVYDSLSLQQIFKAHLDNLQLKNRPPMQVLPSMKGTTDFTAEGETYISSSEWNYGPKPIEVVGDIRYDGEAMDRIKDNVSRHFHLEMFRQFTDITENINHELKVMQIMEIAGEKMVQLIPMMETHESYQKQVDDRIVDIEMQAGRGPFHPMIVEQIKEIIQFYSRKRLRTRSGLKIVFMGTLRKAQQMQQSLKPISYGVRVASEIGASLGDPELARFMIKGYETVDEAFQAVNFPQKLVQERRVFEAQRKAVEEARAQQKQLENMIDMMKASKSVQGPVDPNSVMAQMTGSV